MTVLLSCVLLTPVPGGGEQVHFISAGTHYAIKDRARAYKDVMWLLMLVLVLCALCV